MGHGEGSGARMGWLPLPALHVRDGQVIEANAAADALFGSRSLLALGDADRERLLACCDALDATSSDDASTPVEPVLVRIGTEPPHRFFDLHLGPHPDGGVIVIAHDVTERERLDAVIAEFATGVYLTTADLQATWIPRRVSESTGLTQERFVGSSVYDHLHPDDVEPTRALVERARELPGVRVSRPLRVCQFDQPDVWWPIVAHLIWRGDDPAIGGLLVRFDVDLSAGAEERAEETVQSLVTLAPSSMTGALHLSLAGDLLQRSTRVREILRPLGDDPDVRWRDLLRPEDRGPVGERLAAAAEGTLLPAVEVAFTDGAASVWCRLDVVPYRDAQGHVAGMFVNIADLSSEIEARDALTTAREELWHLANHDALTGLANRYRLAERLASAMDRWDPSDTDGPRPAVIVCDLDRFKEVNDRNGHRIGDQVLVEAARRLAAASGPDDLVCRFGGDEFVVLCDAVLAEGLAERTRAIAEGFAQPFETDGRTFDIGVSVGGAQAEPPDVDDHDALILRADRAMYAAKANGRPARTTP